MSDEEITIEHVPEEGLWRAHRFVGEGSAFGEWLSSPVEALDSLSRLHPIALASPYPVGWYEARDTALSEAEARGEKRGRVAGLREAIGEAGDAEMENCGHAATANRAGKPTAPFIDRVAVAFDIKRRIECLIPSDAPDPVAEERARCLRIARKHKRGAHAAAKRWRRAGEANEASHQMAAACIAVEIAEAIESGEPTPCEKPGEGGD